MYSEVILKSKLIWDYLSEFSQNVNTEIIVVCCSYDLRVCDYACSLLNKTGAKKLIFTGNRGNWTDNLWSNTEAQVFRERAIKNGINPDKIEVEERATNIGENINFSKELFKDNETITFISKPNTILRVKLSIPIHLQDHDSYVSSPKFNFPEDVSNVVGLYGIINEMVGDIQRILEYPRLGFQVEHSFPMEVLEAFNFLIEKGFTSHLMQEVNATKG